MNKDIINDIESLVKDLKGITVEYLYESRIIGRAITHLEYYSNLLQELNDRTTNNK